MEELNGHNLNICLTVFVVIGTKTHQEDEIPERDVTYHVICYLFTTEL